MDESTFLSLRAKRIELERNCTDPEVWTILADEFDKIGAYTNAALCRGRAACYQLLVEYQEKLAAYAV